ncbi:MAG: hypothetical protein MAG451_00138 [Anaerolineales bacterium]|nr:hypothetical protein [Anaerolineales bacterium]
MKNRKLLVAWGPVAVWMGVIFWLSSRSTLPKLPGLVPDQLAKKGGHVVEYAILAGLLWRALRHTTQTRYPAISAFGLTVLYATSDEWHQTFVPGRNGQLLDVLIDSGGTMLSLTILEWWRRSRSGAGSARQPAPDQATRPVDVRDPENTDGA